jgi:hypothetical protein
MLRPETCIMGTKRVDDRIASPMTTRNSSIVEAFVQGCQRRANAV